LAFARNLGLANSRGRVVSFIDDDVTANPSWAKEILIAFSKSHDIGGVSGPTIIPQELLSNRDLISFQIKQKRVLFWRLLGRIYNYFVLENSPYAIGKIFKSGAFSLGANYPKAERLVFDIEVDYLEACNMSFRRDILEKIGGFSLEYGGIGDWSEPDLSFRVKQHGFRLLFNPRAAVMHHLSQRGVFKERGRDSYQRMRNFMHFYFKWIKPNTPSKAVRFGANLIFLNIYWCYKFLETKNAGWLYGILGTFGCLKR
jgi:GT2 family glycosyltransferase